MFKPGKGVRIKLDNEVRPWFESVIIEVNDAVYRHMYSGENVIEILSHFNPDWDHEDDRFGDKAIKTYNIDDDTQLRVTVILTPKNEVRLDIREWYNDGE